MKVSFIAERTACYADALSDFIGYSMESAQDLSVKQLNSPLPDHQERRALAYAKKGIVLALVSGMVFSLDGLLVTRSEAYKPFDNPALWLLAPLVCAGVHDFFSAVLSTFITVRQGRARELYRSLRSKPGRSVIAGALMGALLGVGSYMMALKLAGPAYVLPITTLYPGVAAILAVFLLKERISLRAWGGLVLCSTGAVLIGYTPPESQTGELFYWGLFFAALAAVGWGAQGVLATAGMDFIEPVVALNMYYLISSALYLFIIIPGAAWMLPAEAGGMSVLLSFAGSAGCLFIGLAGIFGAVAYLCWYKSMNMTGVSRAMAVNINYALWAILFSALFTKVEITRSLVVGAVVIVAGMCLVIGNPKDMINLRNVE